jgi:carbonic anhydrase/acetyltransferase-like protein (isoleucine patch superfamily)
VALLIPFNGKRPSVAPDAFLAPTAVLIGDVSVGAQASIWFGAVLRGDDPDNGIVIGPRSSVQDNCLVHTGAWGPTVVGADVTVGHGAKFESCRIGDGSIVGMNAVILQEAVVGAQCVVAAGCVVLEKAVIPDRSLVAGVPGRVRKSLTGSAAQWVDRGGEHYVELSRQYLSAGVGRVSDAREVPAADAGPPGRDDT